MDIMGTDMKDKTKKITKESPKKTTSDKPVSLWGASFTDVLAALLKTKPMPKEGKNRKDRVNNSPKTEI